MSGTLYLESVGGDDRVRLHIARLPCVIGRGRDCDLDLAREQVSRQHARIEGTHGSLIIEDLGSTNGTFVNLERITTPVPVIPGDRIHLGSDEYTLVEGEQSGRTRVPESSSATASHTVIGFTADPTGFPVQTPQFYELLNDELIAIHSQPVVDASGRVRAVTLKAASRHPDLDAQHDDLQHLATQLGEEARLNQSVRHHALQAADRSVLDEHPLILPAHPAELDDLDLLVDELRSSLSQYARLELALELTLRELDHAVLDRLLTELDRLDIQPVLAPPDPRPGEPLELAVEHGAWVAINSHHDTGQFKALCDALPARLNQVIVDCVDDHRRLEQLKGLPDIWLRGHAAAETTPIRHQP